MAHLLYSSRMENKFAYRFKNKCIRPLTFVVLVAWLIHYKGPDIHQDLLFCKVCDLFIYFLYYVSRLLSCCSPLLYICSF